MAGSAPAAEWFHLDHSLLSLQGVLPVGQGALALVSLGTTWFSDSSTQGSVVILSTAIEALLAVSWALAKGWE